MDAELFELCKEVYKRTDWDAAYMYYPSFRHIDGRITWNEKLYEERFQRDADIPLYTSDYLLEKLPYGVSVARLKEGGYTAKKMISPRTFMGSYEKSATPLKALLKLCLALSDAGEL